MKISLTASICAVLMACGLAACGDDAEELNCPGTTLTDGSDQVCMLRTNEVPNGAPYQGLIYITETGARPMPWITEEVWRGFDVARICTDFGFSTTRLRGPLLVCGTHSDWSDDLEVRILAAVQDVAGGGVSDPETIDGWRDSCDAWCGSTCVDDTETTTEQCLAACSLGIAHVGSVLGEACAYAVADLNQCEGADMCAAPLACADELRAADEVCWQCAESADCPETMVCDQGYCAVPEFCGSGACESGQICENDVCVDDTACEAVLCGVGLVCDAGGCIPERNICNEDRTFASDWIADRIDEDIVASFPDTYPAAPGFFSGDDSVGFSKTRTDNLVVWSIEYGPGAGFERSTYPELPQAVDIGFSRQIDITSVHDCAEGAIYTRDGEGTLRDTEAIVVFAYGSEGRFRDTSFVEYQASEESEVVDIASTFRP